MRTKGPRRRGSEDSALELAGWHAHQCQAAESSKPSHSRRVPWYHGAHCQVEKMPDKREVPIGEAMRGTTGLVTAQCSAGAFGPANCLQVSVKRIYLRWHRRLLRSDLALNSGLGCCWGYPTSGYCPHIQVQQQLH